MTPTAPAEAELHCAWASWPSSLCSALGCRTPAQSALGQPLKDGTGSSKSSYWLPTSACQTCSQRCCCLPGLPIQAPPGKHGGCLCAPRLGSVLWQLSPSRGGAFESSETFLCPALARGCQSIIPCMFCAGHYL